jgi:nicotinamidase-related amidase
MSQQPRRALIVIDVQCDYVGGNLPIEYPDIFVSLANIGRAMDGAQAVSIPVVVVRNIAPATSPIFAEGTPGAELHEVVGSRPRDHYIAKKLPSAFAGTDLAEWLAGRGIDTITVAGYMTHNCDFSTIVQAVHAGLSVEFLSDASGAPSYENRAGRASAEDLHRVSCVVMQSRFAAVLATTEWIAALESGAPPVRDNIYGSNLRARQAQVAQ